MTAVLEPGVSRQCNSLNYGVFVFRCFCLLTPPIIKTGRLQDKEREHGRGGMVTAVFLGEGHRGEKRSEGPGIAFPRHSAESVSG